jgi:hypothetical protein
MEEVEAAGLDGLPKENDILVSDMMGKIRMVDTRREEMQGVNVTEWVNI